MDFVIELLAEIFLEGAINTVGDNIKKHTIKKIACILLILAGFVGGFFVLNLVAKLSILPFKSYGTIEYLGRSESGILFGAIFISSMFLSYLALLIVVLMVLGVLFALKKSRKKSEDFTFIEKEKEEEGEKTHTKDVVALLGIVVALFVIVSGILYCYTFNTTTFTKDKIISTGFFNPGGTEYDYSDVKSVDIDYDESEYLELDLHMSNDKTVKFSYNGNAYSEIEKYDDGNDYVFIADLLEKLDSTGATINYKCTYDDVAQYCDDEYKDNLKKVFDFK